MTETEAKVAERAFRRAGWDVTAQQSPLAHRGWELTGKAADGGKPVHGFSFADMKALVLGGQVASIRKEFSS